MSTDKDAWPDGTPKEYWPDGSLKARFDDPERRKRWFDDDADEAGIVDVQSPLDKQPKQG